MQSKYKTDIKKKVKRQVQIVKPDATSEEIDAVLKSGGGADQVFQEAILKVSASQSASQFFRIIPALACLPPRRLLLFFVL